MTTRSWVRRLLACAPRRALQGSRKASARFQPRRVRLCLEALEDRVLPTLGFPIWLDEGPGPRIQSGTAGMISQQNPTTGAVNAVVVSPVNSNTLFAATVNGGIWETTQANNLSPDWKPVLPNVLDLPIRPVLPASQAISDIAFSPLDASNRAVTANTPAGNLVLYAGTGSLSSFGSDGGTAAGLLKSTDGGANWFPSHSSFAGTDLPAEVVRNVVPTSLLGPIGGQVVLVGMVNSGVWRSVDGGSSFTQISGNQNVDGKNTPSGLPIAGVTQLLADPGNSNRFYVALGAAGIYRSDNGGLVWTRIDNGTNAITGLANAVNVRLAVSRDTTRTPAVTVVYAAVVGGTPQLTSVFRSTDAGTSTGGANWTAMDMPGTTTRDVNGNSVFVGLNPGGQAAANFSFTADPNNPNVVYIGGDRQPSAGEEAGGGPNGQFPNFIGAAGYTDRLFRGDASQPRGLNAQTGLSKQWTPITDNFADVDGVQPAPDPTPGTSPHADSRSLLVAPNGDLLETDDGGIYRRSNPTSSTGVWTSVNGNLRDSEFVGIAYDPVNNVIIGGAQDNGVAVQSAYGDRKWREVMGGDGGIPRVDTTTSPGNAIYYLTTQELGGFQRQTRNSSNAIIATDIVGLRLPTATTVLAADMKSTDNMLTVVPGTSGFPPVGPFTIVVGTGTSAEQMTVTAVNGTTWTVTRGPNATGHSRNDPVTGNYTLSQVEQNAQGQSTIGFYQLYVLNKVDPKRMLLGTNILYESTNQGDDLTRPNGMTDLGLVTALAYGGFQGTVGVADVAYVGTNGTQRNGTATSRLYLRQTANGPFVPVAGYTGATPLGIVLDPSNWKTAYIIDSAGSVWRTLDATAANPTWDNITGNLGAGPNNLGVTDLRSIEIIGSGANASLFIGGRGGVYGTDKVQGAATQWVRFGTGLPNVVVTSLDYDSTADVLVAGTLGRGAWLVKNASAFINEPPTPRPPPIINLANNRFTATVNAPVVFTGNNRITINDFGAGIDQVVLLARGGQIRLGRTTGLNLLPASAARSSSPGASVLAFTGTLANINAALDGLTFTPANVSGTASLDVSVFTQTHGNSGGGGRSGSALAFIRIDVTQVNDAPVNTVPAAQLVKTNSNNFAFSTATGNPITIADGDAGTNPLKVTLAVDQGTLLVNSTAVTFTAGANNTAAATLTFSGTLANLNAALQTLLYTPPANFQGQAKLTVTTNDQGYTGPGGATNVPQITTSTVSLTVTAANVPPVISRPAGPLTVAVRTLTVPSQLAFTGANRITISDPDAGNANVTLTLSVSEGELRLGNPVFTVTSATFNPLPTASLNDLLSNLTYVPPTDFQGPVTLAISVNDNGNTGPGGATNDPKTTTALITINVGTAAQPRATAPAERFTTPGAAITFSAANGNGIAVSTASRDVNLEVMVTAEHGTVTLPDPSKLFFTVGEGTADRIMTFSGSPEDIDAALNGLTYVPDPNFRGDDFLTVIVDDPEELGDLTPQPPHNVIDDGGDGDPPQSDSTAASPLVEQLGSAAPPDAALLFDTKTVVIHVQNAATTTTAGDAATTFSTSTQNVTLTAQVTSDAGAVNEGTVTFTLLQGNAVIGTATTSGTLNNGIARVSYALPGGTAAGTYTIDAVYNAGSDFITSRDTSHSVTVAPAAAAIQFTSVSVAPNLLALTQTETIHVHVSGAGGGGTVMFTLNGQPASASVDDNGDAMTIVTLPLLTAALPQSITVLYSGPNANGSATQTVLWGPINALTSSVATFAADGGQSVQSFLAGLPLWDFLYTAQGQLTKLVFGPNLLSWDFSYFGQLTLIRLGGVLPVAITVSTPQGQFLGAVVLTIAADGTLVVESIDAQGQVVPTQPL